MSNEKCWICGRTAKQVNAETHIYDELGCPEHAIKLENECFKGSINEKVSVCLICENLLTSVSDRQFEELIDRGMITWDKLITTLEGLDK